MILFTEFLTRIGCAFLMGTLIGVERQYRQRNAGLRTNILVAVGAAAFTVLSYSMTTGGCADSVGHWLSGWRIDSERRLHRAWVEHCCYDMVLGSLWHALGCGCLLRGCRIGGVRVDYVLPFPSVVYIPRKAYSQGVPLLCAC